MLLSGNNPILLKSVSIGGAQSALIISHKEKATEYTGFYIGESVAYKISHKKTALLKRAVRQ
jgi:hypothetical protein